MTGPTIPVVEETAEVAKRPRTTGTVTLRTEPREVTQAVEADLASETVEIRRIPVGRFVDRPVPDRREGDTVVVSVLEEVLVVEKRLRVVEEIHLIRHHATRHVHQDVTVRKDDVTVDRQPG